MTIKAIPVALALFVAVNVSAQNAKPAAAASTAQKPAMTKQDRINDANKKIAEWQQKLDGIKAKNPKDANVAKLQADLNNYKAAVASYSSAKADQDKAAADQVKTTHEKFMADWKAAYPGAKEGATTK